MEMIIPLKPSCFIMFHEFHWVCPCFSQKKTPCFTRFGGDYRDPSPRDADGTPLVAITAMDALDFRGEDRRWDSEKSLK